MERKISETPETEEMKKAREGLYKLIELQAIHRRYDPKTSEEQLKQEREDFEERMSVIKNLIDNLHSN
jgi:hypothetical protein